MLRRVHAERHLSGRSNWLRAAVLGANDGLVSVSSLLLGVVAGGGSRQATLLAGVAGLAAGALSMAAGEYVSVSSQRDAEDADLALELRELRADPKGELEELAGIYRRRGLPATLAHRVAEVLTAEDALGAHAACHGRALRPSALAFTAGASVPVAAAAAPGGVPVRVVLIVGVTVAALAVLGATGAALGGAPRLPAVARVTLWGAAAMALTAAVGSLFGAAV